MPTAKILQGDVLEQLKTLPSNSVHCCITSPPYWGLRDYGVDGQIGLEETFDEWLAKMVLVFEEVKRVLHPSGTCWVNMGDSYSSGNFSEVREEYGDATKGHDGVFVRRAIQNKGISHKRTKFLPAKNLIGQPWRLAFAMQEAKWILRSDIVWHKPTAMPSSVTDRPTTAHEFIHLFAKRNKYFYDIDAVRSKDKEVSPEKYAAAAAAALNRERRLNGNDQQRTGGQSIPHPNGANLRDVWSMPSEPLSEAHFASFPTQLPRLCLMAGTSLKGCCLKCLEPWYPVSEVTSISKHGGKRKRADAPGAEVSQKSVFNTGEVKERSVIGWAPGCKCNAGDPIPCTVLDPFLGSGTTAIVALRHQRNAIGIELNPEYVEMARRRIYDDAPLLNEVIVA